MLAVKLYRSWDWHSPFFCRLPTRLFVALETSEMNDRCYLLVKGKWQRHKYWIFCSFLTTFVSIIQTVKFKQNLNWKKDSVSWCCTQMTSRPASCLRQLTLRNLLSISLVLYKVRGNDIYKTNINIFGGSACVQPQ